MRRRYISLRWVSEKPSHLPCLGPGWYGPCETGRGPRQSANPGPLHSTVSKVTPSWESRVVRTHPTPRSRRRRPGTLKVRGEGHSVPGRGIPPEVVRTCTPISLPTPETRLQFGYLLKPVDVKPPLFGSTSV